MTYPAEHTVEREVSCCERFDSCAAHHTSLRSCGFATVGVSLMAPPFGLAIQVDSYRAHQLKFFTIKRFLGFTRSSCVRLVGQMWWESCGKRARLRGFEEAERTLQAQRRGEFGNSLEKLQKSVHVWVIDTPVNRVVAERVWQARNNADPVERDVTTFCADLGRTPEENVADILPVIDEHHGADRFDPCNVIELFGPRLNTELRAALEASPTMRFSATS